VVKFKHPFKSPDATKGTDTPDQDQIQSGDPELDDTASTEDPPSKSITLLPREADILYAILAGKENAKIAKELGIDEIAVKEHIKSILRRLRKIQNNGTDGPNNGAD
jgi:DNA-binding NarL/FixJ family response regulator